MIIAFQGVDSKVGTTMIAQSFAEHLAKKKSNSKVLFLIFADNRGRTYIKKSDFPFLDPLIPVIKEPFSAEIIYDNSYVDGNLFIFGGTSRRFKKRELEPEIAVNIIDTAKRNFDYIIIDAGNTMDFGLSMPGITSLSDKLCYVLSQNKSAVDEFLDVRTYFDFYDVHPDMYILNKVEGSDLFAPNLISDRLDMSTGEFHQLPLMKKGRRTESESATFYALKEKQWIKAMENLTDELLRGGE